MSIFDVLNKEDTNKMDEDEEKEKIKIVKKYQT